MENFQGKVAAITGAASGIGRAMAIQLAEAGARVALADVNQQGLMETREQCEQAGAQVTTTILDVSDREGVYAWAENTYQTFGKINLIMNNAGVSLGATVEDLAYEDFEWLMNINFWGVVYGTKAFLPYIKQSGEGHIVNVSSLFGIMSMPCNSAYNASKFAVRGFTEALIEELMVEGSPVGVTCVHPGGIDTNIARGGRVVANPQWGLVNSEQAGKEFKKLARTSPDEAARQILQAVRHRKRRLLIGMDAKLFDSLQRILPTGYQSVVAMVSKRGRKGLAKKAEA